MGQLQAVLSSGGEIVTTFNKLTMLFHQTGLFSVEDVDAVPLAQIHESCTLETGEHSEFIQNHETY